MKLFKFMLGSLTVVLFANCSSSDVQIDEEKEGILVVNRIMYDYEIASEINVEDYAIYHGPTQYISYDSKGKIAFVDKIERLEMGEDEMNRKYTKIVYAYDDRGTLVSLTSMDTQSMNVFSKLNLSYNSLGLLIQSVDEIEQTVLNYGYNAKNEMISINGQDKGQEVAMKLTYNPTGDLIGVYDVDHASSKKKINASFSSESIKKNKNLDFLFSNFPLTPWINTKEEEGFLDCDDKIWKIRNDVFTANPLYSKHEISYTDNEVTLKYHYSLVYKRLRIEK